MVRVDGIEPTTSAWKADVLPLNYTRNSKDLMFRSKMMGSSREFGEFTVFVGQFLRCNKILKD